MASMAGDCYINGMRLRFLFLVGAVLGGLLAYYALWSHLIGRVEQAALDFVAAERQQGHLAEIGAMRRGGFPYRLSLRLEGVSLGEKPQDGPNGPMAGWKLEADTAIAHLQLWNFQHVVFELPGSQRLSWQDAAGQRHQISWQAQESARASLVTDPTGAWQRVAIDLRKLRIHGQDTISAVGSGAGAEAERIQIHLRREANQNSRDVALQITNLTLPTALDGPLAAVMNGPLGRQVADLKLTGRLDGAWFGKDLAEKLRNWRDSGGVLECDTLSLRWGGLAIAGDASLALNKSFRLLGAMGGRLHGAAAGVDALVAIGRMKPEEGRAAKQALAAMEKPDAEGKPHLPLPITAQDGKLSIANVALFALPPLVPAKP